MCLGACKSRVRLFYMRQEKPGCESVTNGKKLRLPSLLSANVYMLRIGELEPNFYLSNKKVEYVSLEIPINRIRVLATCTNQSRTTKELCRELVK